MRVPHILETGTRLTYPERVIFFDSEADTSITISDEEIYRTRENQKTKRTGEEVRKGHDIYFISASFYRDIINQRERKEKKHYYPTEKVIGTNHHYSFVNQFWLDVDAFTPKKKTTYLFAHNAKYDIQVMRGISILVRMGYRVKAFSDSNPTFFELVKPIERINKHGEKVTENKTLMILSSTNYFQQSLEKLGKAFGLKKLDFDHDQKIDLRDKEFVAKMIEYGDRDVEILEAAMISFIDFIRREKLGKFCITLASQTFNAFLSRFMHHDIFIHDDERALEVERKCYAGGRTEAFSMGNLNNRTYYVDINSMYPHVMISEKYPTKLKTFWLRRNIDQVKEVIDNGFLVCAECYVDTPIPIFHKKGERLTFPVGKFWTALSTPEIIEGLKRGLIKEMKNIAVYEGEYIFKEFVDFFYNARLEAKHHGDKVHDLLYKLFMNALYGKFGQRKINWTIAKDEDGKPLEMEPDVVEQDTYFDTEKGIINYKVFGGRMFIEVKSENEVESRNSFPAIASHVTAYARMLLWSAIETAGINHVHYCDTDSLFVDFYGYTRLWLMDMIDEDRLGALKIEDTIKDLTLRGCKDYKYENEEGDKVDKTKGISKSKSTRFLGINENGYEEYAIVKWHGFARRFKDGNFSDYYNSVGIKTLKRNYKKGTIQNNRVLPYLLDEPIIIEETQHKEHKEPKGNAELMRLIRTYGTIFVPDRSEKLYPLYKSLTRNQKGLYFSVVSGAKFDEWLKIAGVDEHFFMALLSKNAV